MSADLNEKRGRRRRQNEEASAAAAATDETEIVEDDTDETEDEGDTGRGYTAPKGKPTVGRRNKQQAQEEDNGIVARSVGGVQAYIQETRDELDKVTWPTRPEVVRLFKVVMGVMVAASAVLGIVSLFFATLFRYGLLSPILFVVFFIVIAVVGFLAYRRLQEEDAGSGGSSRL